MCLQILEDIQRFKLPYLITPVPTILAFFLHHEPLTEEEAYTWSLKVEPRDTSEGYEQLLMEDLQLRRDMEQLQVRNSDLEVCRRDST